MFKKSPWLKGVFIYIAILLAQVAFIKEVTACCGGGPTYYLTIDSFTANPASFAPAGGETTDFSFTVSTNLSSTVYWTLSAGGWSKSGTGTSATLTWNGRDGSGNLLSPGNYTVYLTAYSSGYSDSEALTVSIIPVTLQIIEPGSALSFITDSERRFNSLQTRGKISPDSVHARLAGQIRWEIPANTISGPSNTLTGQGETWNPRIDVPVHEARREDNGRPGPLSYTIKAKLELESLTVEASPVTLTQKTPDPVRQQYVDHNIKVPARNEFSGSVMPLKQAVISGEALTDTAYVQWIYDTRGTETTYRLSDNRSSTWRSPERNEIYELRERGGAARTSLHQYGWAVDWSPISDGGGVPGKIDDCMTIEEIAKDPAIGNAVYAHCYWERKGASKANEVHAQWKKYQDLSDFHFPNIFRD